MRFHSILFPVFDCSYEYILFRGIDGLSGECRQDEAGGVELGVVEAQHVAVLGAHLPHRPGHLHLAPAADQEPDLTCVMSVSVEEVMVGLELT